MSGDRLPASVYWRRRVVVLGMPLLLVVAAVLWVAGRGGHDEATSASTPTPTTSRPPAGTVRVTSGVPDCAPPALTVAIAADSADVRAGVSASFTVTVANTGNTQCVVDAGELHREVVVSSGKDRIWSSKDCAASDSPARSLLLAPGMKDTTHVAWNRVRSAPGCPSEQSKPKAGTYQATVALAGASGGPATFRLR